MIALCNSWQPLSFLLAHNHLSNLPICYLLLCLLGSFLFFFGRWGREWLYCWVSIFYIINFSYMFYIYVLFFFSFFWVFFVTLSWTTDFLFKKIPLFFLKKIWESFGIFYFSCVKSTNFSIFGGKKLQKFLHIFLKKNPESNIKKPWHPIIVNKNSTPLSKFNRKSPKKRFPLPFLLHIFTSN